MVRAVLPTGVTAGQVDAVIERLRRIPDHRREFTLDEEAVWDLYRMPGEVLALLYDHGLPNRHGRADRTDLYNVTMCLGVSAPAVAARRLWAAGLRRDTAGPDRYEIRYQVSCPKPGHDGDCRYWFLLPDAGEVTRAGRERGPVAESVEVSVEVDWPELPEQARSWLDVTAGIDFTLLPDGLCEDVAFIRETGLGDCRGVSRLLVEEGVRRGLPVRGATGLLLAVPYATRHNWAEIRVGRRWVPVDPVLIDAMIGWGLLDSPRWHRYRSAGAIFCRVALTEQLFVTHNGKPVVVTYPARRLPPPTDQADPSAR